MHTATAEKGKFALRNTHKTWTDRLCSVSMPHAPAESIISISYCTSRPRTPNSATLIHSSVLFIFPPENVTTFPNPLTDVFSFTLILLFAL